MHVKWIRPLTTSDPYDHPISRGNTNFAFAYGAGSISTHSASSRGIISIDVFAGTAEVKVNNAPLLRKVIASFLSFFRCMVQ